MANEENNWINDDIDELLKFCINEEMDWLGRKVGTSGLHIIKRTVLMLAATYSKFAILAYILTRNGLEINKASSTDGLTALDCAYLYGADLLIVRMLESRGAKCTQPDDPAGLARACSSIKIPPRDCMDAWLNEDELFMMFEYKVTSCTKNYRHVREACPYLHSDEKNWSRRKVNRVCGGIEYAYVRCVYGPDRCHRGPACTYAHGDYEICYHPHMFRTQMCPQKMLCRIRACPSAHENFEYRGDPSALPPSRNALDIEINSARVTGGDRTGGFEMLSRPKFKNEQNLHGSMPAPNAGEIQFPSQADLYESMAAPYAGEIQFPSQADLYGSMAAPNAGEIQFPSQAGIRKHQNVNPQSNLQMAVGYERAFSNHSQSFTGREQVLHQQGQPTNSVTSSTSVPHGLQSSGFHEPTLEQSSQRAESRNA